MKADSNAQGAVDANVIGTLHKGVRVRQIISTKLSPYFHMYLDSEGNINYLVWRNFMRCIPPTTKKVNVTKIIEIRNGYNTDGLHNASKSYEFQNSAPESSCFSIIYKDPKYTYKSLDFSAKSETKLANYVVALKKLISVYAKNPFVFDEQLWILKKFKDAELNNDNEISMNGLWKLFKKLNLQLDEQLLRTAVKRVLSSKENTKNSLNEGEFIRLFNIFIDLSEYRKAIRLASEGGNEFLNIREVKKFLTEEQGFSEIDTKKAQIIIALYEETKNKNILSVNGFCRLLESRWGNIMKEGHESVFQDMDQPLSHYFINSSHNTYLTGLQLSGNATVEGYIYALRKGARLLELDVFDGEDGEPKITHKHTFISSISLRNALKCILQYAFKLNDYPVILTIENHVGLVQQRVMAKIFIEILGDMLYIPPHNNLKELPSPKALKHKILLRGKTNSCKDSDKYKENGEEIKVKPSVDLEFSRLIALPSAKFTTNLYEDIKSHPYNGSPSLSEGKVLTYLKAGIPIFAYTGKRIVKSYPKGIRQDSSNMNPMPSWICGIQSVAMNMQTPDDEMDIVKGLFNINGNIGYVLKPEVLIKGLDPKNGINKPKMKLHLHIISGKYFPSFEGVDDIVDPFISVEIFGIPQDEVKFKTETVRNNGFNPVWNDTLTFYLYRPELAVMRFSVTDFNSTSMNNFIGEFSIPVTSIRKGYSHIMLNTGFERSEDDAASIFVHIKIVHIDS